jgi:hypothetical protein
MTSVAPSRKGVKKPWRINFEHIAPLAAETFSVSKINANPGVITKKTDY